MIKTNTLFILGAGASKPYGYPTGLELRNHILGGGFTTNITKILSGNDYSYAERQREDLNKFVKKFSGSARFSIDSFLEHRPEFMDTGKIFIARILISFEEDSRLRRSEENWYMYLFNRLDSSFKELGKNNISFITFNYDRSLEYFLFGAIQDSFGKSSSECAEMIKNFPIVHLYGQLDPLPWQESGGKKYSSTELLADRLLASRENIKLMSNERDVENSKEFQDAYKLIHDAERIFFLGFSFDEINLKRLNIDLMTGKEIIGTAFGLEDTRRSWVKQYFSKRSISIGLKNNNIDVLSLLQNHLEIE